LRATGHAVSGSEFGRKQACLIAQIIMLPVVFLPDGGE
jgi:hypothetical protein